MQLRDYQQAAIRDIYASWNGGAENVLAVLPTGAGKTIIFGYILSQWSAPACAIAHRQELVGQISTALCFYKVPHRIIAADNTIRNIRRLHYQEFGRTYYDPSAPVGVAGVDTLIKRKPSDWTRSVTLWVQDEAHHVLKDNKWGKAAAMFPEARGLGVTATPCRADGKGLGRHADGLMDCMVEGPEMRELIDRGYLTRYRIFAPPVVDLDLSTVDISASTGDYSKTKLTKAVHKSRIVGDVVDHYLKLAPGKLGITFAVDVDAATEIAEEFNRRGVPAAVVSAKSPDLERVATLKKFRARELLQLVNVDLFGEGFDLPAVEVVSMARPTQSYALYSQQFGRALRILEGKQIAIIIDHVGNVLTHGLPDSAHSWTLDRRERRGGGQSENIPLKACPSCASVYERFLVACPYCGFKPEPVERTTIEQVDGDLVELDPETLRKLRGEIARIDTDPGLVRSRMEMAGAPTAAAGGAAAQHRRRQEAQAVLRSSIAWWAGAQRAMGRQDQEIYRRFYHSFGVDMATAQTLGKPEALGLAAKIEEAKQ